MITGGLAWIAETTALENVALARETAITHPSFNHGVTGTNPAYGDNYQWLAGAPCGTRVVVASTEMQIGLLNAYSFPMWGDGLCNDVRVVRDTRRGGGDFLHGDRRNLERAIPSAAFVVAFEANRELVRNVARRHGLRAVVVANPPDYYGADQVVFRIEKETRP